MNNSDLRDQSAVSDHDSKLSWIARMRVFRFLPFLILCSSIIAASMIVHNRMEQRQELVERRLLENKIMLANSVDHVEEYFANVHMLLSTVSLDSDVIHMTSDSSRFIAELFEEQWQRHRLAELYVIRRDFDGTSGPLMTFEREEGGHSVDEVHSLENEEQEYALQKAQIRRFEADSSLNALISDEIELCTGKAGIIYSVPVWSGGRLRGIVSAMVLSDMVRRELGQGNLYRSVVLVSSSGHLFRWDDGYEKVMEQVPSLALADGKTLLSSPVKVSSHSRWWLLLKQTNSQDILGWSYWLDLIVPSGALFFGLAFSLMVARLHKNHRRQNRYVEQLLEKKRVIKETSRNLHYRVTELNCLHKASEILGDAAMNEHKAICSVVDLIPLASRRPERTFARITIDDKTCESKGFEELPVRVDSDILVEDARVGAIELFGSEEVDEDMAQPLGPEDQVLIDALARAVGSFIERRRAQEEIKQLAQIPLDNPSMILKLDEEARVTYMNPAAVKTMTELNRAPETISDFLPEDIQGLVESCVSSGRTATDLQVTVDGLTWLWTLRLVRGQRFVHAWATDITHRVRREAELQRLTAAVNQSASLIVITATDGTIEYTNPQFCRFLGYSAAEVVGQRTSILKSGRHGPAFYRDMWQTIALGKPWAGTIQNRKKDGSHYWERKTITPIFGDGGEIRSFLSVGEDITTERRLQQRAAEQEKLSAVGMLAAGVAHEFKNYLAGIIGNASLALEELDNNDGLETARDTLQTVVTLGERANEVAMSLLTYSRAQTETAARPEDLAELISKSIKLVKREIEKCNIEIVTAYEDVPPVSVSSGKIQQLLLNLIINARDAIGSDGVITISLLRLDDSAQIKVGDSGAGIPEKDKAHIFDPFFSTKGVWGDDDVTGTGIGLSVCRNTAEEHGGTLVVDSVEGKGTTFTLTLPLSSPGERVADRLKAGAGFKPVHVLLFSLDRSLDGKYTQQAVEVGSELDSWDKVSSDPKVDWSEFDFVICDGRFAAILELLRMTELCDINGVPYVVINSEAVDLQIADVVERAVASFGSSPSLVELMESVSRGRSPIAT